MFDEARSFIKIYKIFSFRNIKEAEIFSYSLLVHLFHEFFNYFVACSKILPFVRFKCGAWAYLQVLTIVQEVSIQDTVQEIFPYPKMFRKSLCRQPIQKIDKACHLSQLRQVLIDLAIGLRIRFFKAHKKHPME